MRRPKLKQLASQPSWTLGNDDVGLAVTQLGGHMGPVAFYRKTSSPVQPYYVNPWHREGGKVAEPVLRPLRGDFFCMPFGANAESVRGEQYCTHGDTATRKWTLADASSHGDVSSLAMTMKIKTKTKIKNRIRTGKVIKTLSIVAGQNVVYARHRIEGVGGRMPLGHHATLAMPDREGSVRVATSRILFGMTNPAPVGDPARGEYSSTMPDRRFNNLSRVPLIWSDTKYGDFSALPARTGFTDIVAVFNRAGVRTPAWTTATFEDEGFVWFSLKDPAVLPATLLWVSNRGRHGPPWNGRNRCLGLEDICGFFADGLAASLKANSLTRCGIATAVRLSVNKPTTINYIQGVVRVPRGFKRVRSARFEKGRVTFTSLSGRRATAAVNHDFLRTGELT